MNISVYEQISVSEAFASVSPPALFQGSLGIISGRTYRLNFNTLITSGVLKAYQGTQLVYSSAIVFVGSINSIFDTVRVRERLYIDFVHTISVYEDIAISELITLNEFSVEASEGITVSENVSISVI